MKIEVSKSSFTVSKKIYTSVPEAVIALLDNFGHCVRELRIDLNRVGLRICWKGSEILSHMEDTTVWVRSDDVDLAVFQRAVEHYSKDLDAIMSGSLSRRLDGDPAVRDFLKKHRPHGYFCGSLRVRLMQCALMRAFGIEDDESLVIGMSFVPEDLAAALDLYSVPVTFGDFILDLQGLPKASTSLVLTAA